MEDEEVKKKEKEEEKTWEMGALFHQVVISYSFF